MTSIGTAAPPWPFWDQMHQVMSTASTKRSQIYNDEQTDINLEDEDEARRCQKIKRRATNFTEDEIHMILWLWASEDIQLKFKKCTKLSKSHGPIYEEMARALSQQGYERTPEVIQNKINNLKAQYFSHKKILPSGTAPPAWPYWDKMHQVLAGKCEPNDMNHSTDHIDQSQIDPPSVQVFASLDNIVCKSPNTSNSEDVTITAEDPLGIFEENSYASSSCSGDFSSPVKTPATTSVKNKEKYTRKLNRRQERSSLNLILKQLVVNEKRTLALAEKRAKLDELAMKREAEVAAASIGFFKAFTALAERSLQNSGSTTFPTRLIPDLESGNTPSQTRSFVDMMSHVLEQRSSATNHQHHDRLTSETNQTRPPDMMNGRNEL